MPETTSFGDLWKRMTAAERKQCRAQIETEVIERMPHAFILASTDAQLHREAKRIVNDLIDHCQRTA